MATIIKRCDHDEKQWARCTHSWVVRFRNTAGRQLEESFPHNRKKVANEYAKKVEGDKLLGVVPDRKQAKRIFRDCFQEYLQYGVRTESTLDTYKGVYKNHLDEMFGDRRIGSITLSDLVRWEDNQRTRGYKPYGIEVRKNIFKGFLKYCYEAEIIPAYPAKAASSGRRDTSYRAVDPVEIPSTEEVMAIYEAMRSEIRASVWIQAGCGLRVGEALAFSRSHLERRAGWYHVQNQVTAHGAKGETKWSRVGRWVPVSPSVSLVLKEHTRLHSPWGDEGWYFRSATAEHHYPRRTYTGHWKEALKGAGLEASGYTPKSLRHYFASIQIASAVPTWELAQWLGHSSTIVTERVYAHLVKGAEVRVVDAFEAAVGGVLSKRLLGRRR